jgi:hypothetical protein
MPIPRDAQRPAEKLWKDFMWSDPYEASSKDDGESFPEEIGWKASQRGAGVLFSKKITDRFLSKNGLAYIIRSHQMVQKGYKSHHDSKVYTLFSASRYIGSNTNKGAIAVLDFTQGLTPQFRDYYADDIDGIHDYDIPLDILGSPSTSATATATPTTATQEQILMAFALFLPFPSSLSAYNSRGLIALLFFSIQGYATKAGRKDIREAASTPRQLLPQGHCHDWYTPH